MCSIVFAGPVFGAFEEPALEKSIFCVSEAGGVEQTPSSAAALEAMIHERTVKNVFNQCAFLSLQLHNSDAFDDIHSRLRYRYSLTT